MVEPAVSAVVESIKDLATQETALLCGVIGEAGFLKAELQRLQGLLKDADTKRRSGNENAAICISQIRDAIYEAENVLEVVDYMDKRNRLKKGFIGVVSRYARLPSDGNMLTSTPNLRTLFGFEIESFFLPNLRFLRVLHVEKSNLVDFGRAIKVCVHLRYLCLRRCRQATLPSSIGQFLYLQTIDLSNTIMKSYIPCSIWDIPTLRHVYLEDRFLAPRNCAQKELQTFHLWHKDKACSKYFKRYMVAFLAQTTQLTTLFLVMHSMPTEMIHLLANMNFLVDVVLSKFTLLDKFPESQHFPQGLRRLCLEADTIKEDPMPILEKLPCLVEIFLSGYRGQTMFCSKQGFPRLQELTLSDFYIEEWRMEVEAMPRLSHLRLRSCLNMRKLPEGLLHLPSLEELELFRMNLNSEDDITWKKLEGRGCMVGPR